MKKIRIEYAETLFSKLHISISVEGGGKLTGGGPYLLVSNHRSVIDPLVIELALKDTTILGYWLAKKELYNSFFFGLFVRNTGSILTDRDAKQATGLFADIKNTISNGYSIFVFPEGTRNKTQSPLGDFKKGSEIIARRSKLDVLPIYIKTNTNDILMESLANKAQDLVINVEVGEVVPYDKKSKPLEVMYKSLFDIS